jgi:hypothetical protein
MNLIKPNLDALREVVLERERRLAKIMFELARDPEICAAYDSYLAALHNFYLAGGEKETMRFSLSKQTHLLIVTALRVKGYPDLSDDERREVTGIYEAILAWVAKLKDGK